MEEINEEKTQAKKKTRATNTRKKKEVNSRISDVLQRLEVEGEKEQNSKEITQKNKDEKKIKEDSTNKTTKENTKDKSNNLEKDVQKKSKKVDKSTEQKSVKKNETAKNNTKSTTKNSEKNKSTSNKKDKVEIIDKKESKEKVKTTKKARKDEEINDSEKLIKIEEEITKQKQIPKEVKEKVYKKVFVNLLIAISMTIYLIFINLGYKNINEPAFITDLQVFSITLIITTIVIFEQAYKKDSGKLTIYGIEVLILSIITMVLPRIYNEYKDLFVDTVGITSIAFIIYYIVKAIIIYVKMKAKIRKSDIKKIAKK